MLASAPVKCTQKMCSTQEGKSCDQGTRASTSKGIVLLPVTMQFCILHLAALDEMI